MVVDDGSDDDTTEIVNAIAARDDRIQAHRQPNRGVAAARNRGVAEARGTYIAPLDADDVWVPRKLEWQVQWKPHDQIRARRWHRVKERCGA